MDRTRGGGRYYERYKKSRQGGEQTAATIKITIFTAMLLLACVLRFADYPALKNMRAAVASVLQTDGDYKGAVEVLGRAISGNTDDDENVIAVFGRKIFGLDGDKATGPEQSEPPEPAETEPPEQTAPAGTTPDEPATQAPSAEKAGEISGFTLASLEYSCESPPPAAASALMLSAREPVEESAPPPPAVPENVNELAFEYAAPALGRISSRFGYRTLSSTGETAFHHGVDIAIDTGTAVKAFAAGTVSETGSNSVYGNYIRIGHADGFESMYAHLSKISVKKGKSVKLGDKIGESGSSGNALGAHLHFELRKDGEIIDPLDYLSFE